MKTPYILKSLGFDEKQERVYRTLLSLGDAPATRIAKQAGMKRTSVYYVLEELVKMGLISTYVERGTTRYFAEHPRHLKAFFEEKALMAERFIPLLQKESSMKHSIAQVQVFEGINGVKAISNIVLQLKDTIILSLGSSKRLMEITEGTFGYGARRRQQKIFSRSLRFKEDNPRNDPARFNDIRILPDTFEFPGYLTIFDNSVSIIPFEEPPRGILISDPACAKMMRSTFEILWNLLGQRIR